MLEKKVQIYTSAIFSLFVIGYIYLFSLSWSVTTSIAECTFLFLLFFKSPLFDRKIAACKYWSVMHQSLKALTSIPRRWPKILCPTRVPDLIVNFFVILLVHEAKYLLVISNWFILLVPQHLFTQEKPGTAEIWMELCIQGEEVPLDITVSRTILVSWILHYRGHPLLK